MCLKSGWRGSRMARPSGSGYAQTRCTPSNETKLRPSSRMASFGIIPRPGQAFPIRVEQRVNRSGADRCDHPRTALQPPVDAETTVRNRCKPGSILGKLKPREPAECRVVHPPRERPQISRVCTFLPGLPSKANPQSEYSA